MVIEKIVVPGRFASESRFTQRKQLGEHQADSEDAVVFEHENNQKEQQHSEEKQPGKDDAPGEEALLQDGVKNAQNAKSPIHVVV